MLDVGCGAGQTLIASRLGPDVRGIGVDVAHDALVLGRSLAPRLAFVRAGGEALPFRGDAFDLVICRVALPYMHIPRALAEMGRVLARHGDLWLVLHPWSMTAREWVDALRAVHVRKLVHRTYIVLNSIVFHLTGAMVRWPRGGYESFQTRRAMRRGLSAAGFVDVRISRTAAFIVRARKR